MNSEDDPRYADCKTGEECNRMAHTLKLYEQRDIQKARETHRNFWVHKIIEHYKCNYENAEREFDQYGTMRLP